MKKIILAEPNIYHRTILANILRNRSIAVFTLNSFSVIQKALINCTEGNLPDLLIIGYGISYNNTLELLKIIKEKQLSTKMKVFKICSDVTSEMGYALIEAGINDYMNLAAYTKELFIEKIDSLFKEEPIVCRVSLENVSKPETKISILEAKRNIIKTKNEVINSS